MPCREGGLHGLKPDPSARADDQNCRHGLMLPVGSAWLTVMCDAAIAGKNLAAALEQKHLRRIHDIRRATERLGQGRFVGTLGYAVCPPSPSTR